MGQGQQRSSSCSVDRGLYVLRYVSSDSADVAPVAFIKAAAGSESLLRFTNAPGTVAGVLSGPGTCLVVASEGYAKVDITVTASESSKVLDAKFALELLVKGDEVDAAVNAPAVASPAALAQSSVQLGPSGGNPAAALPLPSGMPVMDILAHVSRRGDVTVAPDQWIAGPDAPTPVEGVQIRCRGADMAISAQVMSTAQPGVWSSWWSAADFVGSRQQANPLTGLRLKLVGRDAQRFEIDAEAMFLGMPLQRQTGSEVSLSTPSGFDLLVGLKLGLKSATRQEVPATLKQEVARSVKSSRVRVFRSDKADLVNS